MPEALRNCWGARGAGLQRNLLFEIKEVMQGVNRLCATISASVRKNSGTPVPIRIGFHSLEHILLSQGGGGDTAGSATKTAQNPAQCRASYNRLHKKLLIRRDQR